jgi:heterotetrameric sarcosine oxidase gamma subunit
MADVSLHDARAFAQDLFPWVTPKPDTPGVRAPTGMRVTTVRHIQETDAARQAVVSAGLSWPERINDLSCSGRLLIARRNPEEIIVVGDDSDAIQSICVALASGSTPDAIAIDISDGMRVYELAGPSLEHWLSHLIDPSSIPVAGKASRGRLSDVAVMLLRPAPDRVLMVADRSLSPYLAQWLAFAHESAFART